MKKKKLWAVEVSYKQGVTDAVADTVKKGINDLGIRKVSKVATVQKYIIEGDLTSKETEKICKDLLANPVIQNFSLSSEDIRLSSVEARSRTFKRIG